MNVILAALWLLTSNPARAADPAPSMDKGLGPMKEATAAARKWESDACWAGLDYKWTPVTLMKGDQPGSKDYVEEYAYYFLSDMSPELVFIARYKDVKDAESVSRGLATTGHYERGEAPLADCLARTAITIGPALWRAREAGVPLRGAGTVRASLREIPKKEWRATACRTFGKSGPKATLTCPERVAHALRQAEGSEVWRVESGEKEAYVDAVTGTRLR